MKLEKVIFTSILTGIALFPYTSKPLYSYIFFAIFTLILCFILLIKKKVLVNKYLTWPLIIFFFLLLIIIFQSLIRTEFNSVNSSADIAQRFLVVLIFIITIANLQLKNISQVLNSTLFVFFTIGLGSLINFYLTGDRIFNENTLGFFIIPYLGLKIARSKRIFPKILIYIIGIILLYLTAGRASLLAFLLTPLWFWIMKYPLIRRIFPVLYIFISVIMPFAFIEIILQVDGPLTGRGGLQEAYTLYLKDNFFYLFFGTGEFFLRNELTLDLGPHNSWLSLMFTYGLVGLVANVLFILYCINVKEVNEKEKILLLILYYILTIQNFEVINLGGVSFLSLLFLSCLLLLKKIEISQVKMEQTEPNGCKI